MKNPFHSTTKIWQDIRHKLGFPNKKIMTASTKSVKLTIFLMRVMGLWHSSGKSEKFWSNLMLTLVFISMIYSMYVQGQELYYSWNSIKLITFAAPAATVVLTETSKLVVFIAKRQKVTKLNKFVDYDFWKRSYTDEEKRIFNDCDVFCFRAICLCLSLMFGTCSHYLFQPVIGMITDNTSRREFPFPMRFETKLYESPFYEWYFALEIIGTFATGLCVSTFTSYLFVINLFTAVQFKILNLNLKSLCDFGQRWNGDKNLKCQKEALQKLKIYIVRHQMLIDLTKEIEDLYSYVLLEQVFGSVTQTCFCGIQILLVESTPQRTFLGIEFLISNFLQLYFYCFSSHAVFVTSENVSRAVYFIKWFKLTDRKIRKEFTQLMGIVATRARRPCVLTVGKFYPLTLATFTSVISTSMSYFTVLRQLVE